MARNAPIRPAVSSASPKLGNSGGRSGVAGDVGIAGVTLGERAEARAVAVRAGLAEAGDAQHDEPRVDLAQHVVAEPPALERTLAIVLDQDVGIASPGA